MAAENNIIIKITGEADLDAAQKELKNLINRSGELESQIDQLSRAEKEDKENLKKMITDRNALAKALNRNAEYYKGEKKAVKEAIAANKQNIKSINDQIKAYKTLNGISGKAVQQLRAMRERLMELEEAGEYGTQAFIDLSVRAAELEDQIGDTQQRIRILASDTKEMDAVMGLGDGLAGTFYIATSAAEVFGDDLEGLQKAFYKVQAALSIVNGLQQVANVLNKDSNINVVISTALKKKYASAIEAEGNATAKTTIKQRLLNAAMKANPAGVLITAISALVAIYTAMSTILSRVGDSQARLNKLQAENKSKELADFTRMQIDLMQARGASAIEVVGVEKEAAAQELQIRQEAYDKAKKMLSEANLFNREKRKEDYDNAQEEWKRANEAYIDAVNKENAQELADLVSNKNELNQTRVDLLQEGADKEIEQIRLNYEQKKKQYQGGSETERALLAALEKKEAKEIAEIRRRYVVQEQQAQIDLMREGEAKEIAQIKLNYQEQVRQYQGKSKEMIAMRKALKEKEEQAIADVQRRYAIETQKTLTEIDVKAAEERTKKLTGSEGVEEQLRVWDDYYQARKYQIEENMRVELEEVDRSTDSEELKAAKRKKIAADAQASITDLEREGKNQRLDIMGQEITGLELLADKASYAAEHTQGTGRLQALKSNLDAQLALYDAQQKQLNAQWEAGTIQWQDYEQQKWEITKASTDARRQYEMDSMQTIVDGFEKATEYIQQFSSLIFDAISDQIQREMDDLDEYYTTDAEEAKENANKRYLTEKELEDKKLTLKRKAAAVEKAQAAFDIALNTALAIMRIWADVPKVDFGATTVALTAVAAAIGAAQLAMVLSKPLPKYAKGRKGGKGEYAMVGEKGPEIMYVPSGASIVPNYAISKQDTWPQFNVPKLEVPQIPALSSDFWRYAPEQTAVGLNIDYDKLGAAVAKNIPSQKSVTVNVDRNGIIVSEEGNMHKILNKKYQASWT